MEPAEEADLEELAPEDEGQGRLFAGLVAAAKQHRAERLCAQGATLS